MKPSIRELISASLNSSRYTNLLAGHDLVLTNGQSFSVNVKLLENSVRPVGLRLAKYAFISEVSANGHIGVGFGESEVELIAVQKSISEGIERVIGRATKGTIHSCTTTSGWAAHVNRARAEKAALQELLERDAILTHWFSKTPMTEIDDQSWPSWLSKWAKTELTQAPNFNQLRLLVSEIGYIPTVTTIFMNHNGHAVLSHATSENLDEAIYKALAESCRIAQMAFDKRNHETSLSLLLDQQNVNRTTEPDDHAMIYAYHQKFPNWFFGKIESWKDAKSKWQKRFHNFDPTKIQHEFHEIMTKPLIVGYCTSSCVQKLFFGSTRDAFTKGLINFNRFEKVLTSGEENLLPHCVS